MKDCKKLLEGCVNKEDDAAQKSQQRLWVLRNVFLRKKKEASKAAGEAFNVYAMLLGDMQHVQLESWVKKMTNSESWINLQGKAKKGKHGLTLFTFHDCIMCHLKSVFEFHGSAKKLHDACLEETVFMDRFKQLDLYLPHLPCWYYSPDCMEGTPQANSCLKLSQYRKVVL